MNIREQWTSFLAILYREICRFLRIWMQTLLPPVVTIALYLIIFGDLIGSRIGAIKGYSYIDFIVPGLVIMAVITSSYANVSSSFFSAKFQRFIEEVLVSPTPGYIVVLGFVIGGVVRGLIVGGIALMIAMFFTDLIVTHYWATIGIVVMTAILFSLGGFINAVYANSFDDVAVIPTFVLTPLVYLGGVFYSVNMLSEVWSAVSRINPILYIVNTFRYGILGITDVDITWAFVLVGGFGIIAYIAAIYLLNHSKRLRQ